MALKISPGRWGKTTPNDPKVIDQKKAVMENHYPEKTYWRQIWRVAGSESCSPELLGLPGSSRLSRKFPGDFPGSSLTEEIDSNPEVPWKFLGNEKIINIKNFGGTTPGVCVCVCVSRLSHGHVPSVPSYILSVPRTFCPKLELECSHKPAQTSRVSLGRPEFIPGTLPGHSDHQIPLWDFS